MQGLSLARVFLHTSNPLKKDDDVDDEHERLTGYSVAEITESLFNYANSALTRIGLGHDHHVVTVRFELVYYTSRRWSSRGC